MPKPKDRNKITINLGELRPPLDAAAEAAGRTLSDEIRRRLARSLRLPVPQMPVGAAALPAKERTARGKAGAAARWGT